MKEFCNDIATDVLGWNNYRLIAGVLTNTNGILTFNGSPVVFDPNLDKNVMVGALTEVYGDNRIQILFKGKASFHNRFDVTAGSPLSSPLVVMDEMTSDGIVTDVTITGYLIVRVS